LHLGGHDGVDLYCLVFKSLHIETAKELRLTIKDKGKVLEEALIAFCLQGTFFYIVFSTIFQSGTDTTKVCTPTYFLTFMCRFFCGGLMHMELEHMTRQGMDMMKYVMNHPLEFSSPRRAFMVGFFSFMTTALTEVVTFCLIATIDEPVDIVVKQTYLATLAKFAAFYAAALPASLRIKGHSKPMKIKVYRVIREEALKDYSRCSSYCSRYTYAVVRLAYSVFIYYWLPLLTLNLLYFGDMKPCYSSGH
jgi:hypothetical protein